MRTRLFVSSKITQNIRTEVFMETVYTQIRLLLMSDQGLRFLQISINFFTYMYLKNYG